MRRKFQYIVLFAQTFIRKHKKPILLSGLFGFFLALLFIQIYPFYRGIFLHPHYTIGIIGTYTDENLPPTVQDKISFGLTSLTHTREATPSLATAWKVDDKGTTYLFQLKKNVVWHDGKPFTAEDVRYTFRGTSFTPVDQHTLKITLNLPYAPLPELLTTPLIRPNFLGMGEYRVTTVTREAEDTLASIHLVSDREESPTYTYKFYPNEESAIVAYKMGEIDQIESISSPPDLAKWNNVQVVETTQYDRYVGIFFNLSNDLFKDKEIRQALAYGIPDWPDREQALTPISPLSWAYSTKVRLYRHDIEAARKILSKSPLASDSAQFTVSTFPSTLKTAQKVVDAWKEAGVTSQIRVESGLTSDYDIFILTQMIPADPDQYQYWQSTQEGTNWTHYNNPKIDKLLEDGRKTFDKEQRKKIYADFQRYLVDDVPVIFLYYPKVYSIERK